jgi:hypothetical protein
LLIGKLAATATDSGRGVQG